MTALVLVELDGAAPADASLRALTLARSLGDVNAVVFADAAPQDTLASYPSLPGRLRAKRAAVDRSSPAFGAEGLRKQALRVPESSQQQAEVLGEGVDAVPSLVRVLEEWGVLS